MELVPLMGHFHRSVLSHLSLNPLEKKTIPYCNLFIPTLLAFGEIKYDKLIIMTNVAEN